MIKLEEKLSIFYLWFNGNKCNNSSCFYIELVFSAPVLWIKWRYWHWIEHKRLLNGPLSRISTVYRSISTLTSLLLLLCSFFFRSHLIGLDAACLDVHNAVTFDLLGGRVPADFGRAVFDVWESQVHGRQQRHWREEKSTRPIFITCSAPVLYVDFHY